MIQKHKTINICQRRFRTEFHLLVTWFAPDYGTGPGSVQTDYTVFDPARFPTVHLILLIKYRANHGKTVVHLLPDRHSLTSRFIHQGLHLLDIPPQILQQRFRGLPDQLPAFGLLFAEIQILLPGFPTVRSHCHPQFLTETLYLFHRPFPRLIQQPRIGRIPDILRKHRGIHQHPFPFD